MSDDISPETQAAIRADITRDIRASLDKLVGAWADTDDPMNAGHGTSSSGATPLPSSTIVLRADITLTLAYWVHALVDAFPVVLQHLETGDDGKLTVVTETLDCTDVPAMAELLRREVDRIAEHEETADRLAKELAPLANAASFVSRPPRKDRITLGHCRCGGHITVRAVPWIRVPQPTTDPGAYPLWTDYQPEHEQAIRCPGCHASRTVPEWFAELVGPQRLVDAVELVELIHADLGMRYSTKTVRTWVNRGLIRSRGKNNLGHNVYDRTQVYAALIDRERMTATG